MEGRSPEVAIGLEPADSADAASLVEELETHLASLYPASSRHGFSVQRLVAEGVRFFVLRSDGVAAACGGILFVGSEYAEIKRMYVRPPFRGHGYGRRVLEQLEAHARSHGIPLLRLETGVHQQEAIGLYEGMGFHRVPPFKPYFEDPLSLCFEKSLD